jgi:hypothetical protein
MSDLESVFEIHRPELLKESPLNYAVIAYNRSLFLPILHILIDLECSDSAISFLFTAADVFVKAHPQLQSLSHAQLIQISEVHLSKLFLNRNRHQPPCLLPSQASTVGPLTISQMYHSVLTVSTSLFEPSQNSSFAFVPLAIAKTLALFTHCLFPTENFKSLITSHAVNQTSPIALLASVIRTLTPSDPPRIISRTTFGPSYNCLPPLPPNNSDPRLLPHAMSTIAVSLLNSWFLRYSSISYTFFNEPHPQLTFKVISSFASQHRTFYSFTATAIFDSYSTSDNPLRTDLLYLEKLRKKIFSPAIPHELREILCRTAKIGQFQCTVTDPEFFSTSGLYPMAYVLVTSLELHNAPPSKYTQIMSGIISIPNSRLSFLFPRLDRHHSHVTSILPFTVCNRHFQIDSTHSILGANPPAQNILTTRAFSQANSAHAHDITLCDPSIPPLHVLIENGQTFASQAEDLRRRSFSNNGLDSDTTHQPGNALLPSEGAAPLSVLNP